MAKMVEITCHNKRCKKKKMVREADVKRGWGKFCSKSCKAQEQEDRTGQYKSHCCNRVNGIFKRKEVVLGQHEFFANFSNEFNEDNYDMIDDDGNMDDWAYDSDSGVSYGHI